VKDSGYYLIELVEKKASYVPQFKEIENEVRKHYIFFEKNRLAAEEARLILEKAKAGEPLDKVARAKGFGVDETGFFQPGDSIPKIGVNQGDAETLYQLSAANPYPANPLFVNGTYIVFKLKGTSKVESKDFEEKKAAYERMLLNVKQEEAMRSWLDGNKEALIKAKRISIKKHAQDL
jgi:parvulin-like peptidyl-prolyl isomerase